MHEKDGRAFGKLLQAALQESLSLQGSVGTVYMTQLRVLLSFDFGMRLGELKNKQLQEDLQSWSSDLMGMLHLLQ